jgi:hypothetical protein
MSLPGNDLLSQIENAGDLQTLAVKLGQYMRSYVNPAIQKTAQNSAVSPVGKIAAPAPPESVSVTPATTGDMVQVVVNHNAKIQKGAHYIYSIADNPQFTNAMIEAKPATRSPVHFSLPTYKSDGLTKHDYHVAVQVQYPGSDPSDPTYHGGDTPASFNLNGSAASDLQAGTGSGTAVNGGQALVGLGKSQVRLAQGSKRSV